MTVNAGQEKDRTVRHMTLNEARIAPYAGYFTDRMVMPLARVLKVSERVVAGLLLVGVAVAEVDLARLALLL